MIHFVTGDLFESGADCLMNTVNCEGFMGKGVAYQFKMRFPKNNESYAKACKTGELQIGKIHYFIEEGKTIINFPTKDRWRAKSKIEYVEAGMKAFVELLPHLHVKQIAIPPLGCGNGGLDWFDVKKKVIEALESVQDDYEFYIFEPSQNYTQKPKEAPSLSLSGLVIMDIKMHLERTSKLRLQKTAFLTNYFLGEEYFRFDKHKFGPYAYSIDIVAKKIGEYQKYYNLDTTGETYNMLYKVLCSEKTDRRLEKINQAVEQAADYVNQIKSDKELEGITTVLYLLHAGQGCKKDEVVYDFKKWSEDKANRFSENEIISYLDYLEGTNMVRKDIWDNYEIL